MTKRVVLAILAVFVVWAALDFVIHGLILGSTYASMPQLWRPQNEMKLGVMYLALLIGAVGFVAIYDRFIDDKGLRNALSYGLWFGLATGVPMGYGTYSVQPIPYSMALTWCLGTIVEAAVAGLVIGVILRGGSRGA